ISDSHIPSPSSRHIQLLVFTIHVVGKERIARLGLERGRVGTLHLSSALSLTKAAHCRRSAYASSADLPSPASLLLCDRFESQQQRISSLNLLSVKESVLDGHLHGCFRWFSSDLLFPKLASVSQCSSASVPHTRHAPFEPQSSPPSPRTCKLAYWTKVQCTGISEAKYRRCDKDVLRYNPCHHKVESGAYGSERNGEIRVKSFKEIVTGDKCTTREVVEGKNVTSGMQIVEGTIDVSLREKLNHWGVS
ncbi:hypothetical protein PIB30_094050, partial [Stylosanthes scabra]|nr:hypothetical protein [Stylosanthes scabra]